MIVGLVDYDHAAKERRDLAEKMIYAQLSLAKLGFSTGGRPSFGLRRWLVQVDGIRVRQLAEGERIRMAAHHVIWLPGPEDELALIRRILGMLKLMPASRVAAILTAEGVPPPDDGRTRTDRGFRHPASGVWHQATIVGIARNPLLLSVVEYSKRSMGDEFRFSPEGPRHLEDSDWREDGEAKVVVNPEALRIKAKAKFEPLVDRAEHEALLQILDERAGTQRGKPRSRQPSRNPLGGRVFDLACGWPMYRQTYLDSFR